VSGWLGEAFAFISVVSFSFASVAVSKASQDGRRGGGALLSVVMTAGLSMALWLVTGAGATFSLPWVDMSKALFWFAVSGLLTTAAGRALYFVSVHDLGAVRATATKRVTPLFSALLAVVVLGEVLTHRTAAGLALVMAGTVLLFSESLRQVRRRRQPPDEASAAIWRGYGSGTLSALTYAGGYIARKLGLAIVADGAFGTMVGALTALLYFAAVAAFDTKRRAVLRAELAMRDVWNVLAAMAISIGQISVFAALQFTTVTRVAIISSLEVVVTMSLAVFVLRSETMPGAMTLLATVVATVGVLVIVL